MDYSITYHFPVNEHIYKFLVTKHGTDTIKASRKNLVGSVILSMLSKNEDQHPIPVEGDRIIHVIVSDSFYNENNSYISPKIAHAFNGIFECVFREEMFSHAFVAKITCKDFFIKSIFSFMDFYNISEDDMNSESLYRDFKRKKEAREWLTNPQINLFDRV